MLVEQALRGAVVVGPVAADLVVDEDHDASLVDVLDDSGGADGEVGGGSARLDVVHAVAGQVGGAPMLFAGS